MQRTNNHELNYLVPDTPEPLFLGPLIVEISQDVKKKIGITGDGYDDREFMVRGRNFECAPAHLDLVCLICGAITAAAIFGMVAVAGAGFAGWQLALFARELHRLIEAAAQERGLVPVDPLARAPLPVGPVRTADADD